MPSHRWSSDPRLERADPRAKRGGFLERLDELDAEFFGVSPREAALMDPQQRLVLELGWEALEDARLAPDRVRRHRIGVVMGSIWNDWAALVARSATARTSPHAMTGTHRSLIANRLSYALGLQGLSLTVDSAQSSSLVAVHVACASLLQGESDLVLAGGVNLVMSADSGAISSGFGALSQRGYCAPFDAGADGYVRGEGGGVVALKRLDDALADGDRIYCVIRGSAVNHDGASRTLTTPDRAAQEQVIRAAYRAAGVSPAAVQYVELHGSGTPVGDPIEAAALGAALGAPGEVAVGSIKSNLGHLEGAAGIAGLIKVALCVYHRTLVPSLHFERANPEAALDRWRLRVQTETSAWPDPSRALIAGVTSIGMGGTNCHVVLEQAPVVPPAAPARHSPPGPLPCVVSARTPAALQAQAARLLAHLDDRPEVELADVAWSLLQTRSGFEQRAAIVAADRAELRAGLEALREGRAARALVQGACMPGATVAFVFPGQGAQWAAMAEALLTDSAVFRASMAACAAALDPHLDRPLFDLVRDPDALTRVELLQPLLFAVMVSLAALWRSHGVTPSAVIGHSQGEIAAAYVAGALTLEDAARIVCVRSRLGARLLATTGAVAVALGAAALTARIARWGDRLAVAADNGPNAAVVAGELGALDELIASCAADGVRARRVAALYASHSSYVEPLRDEMLAELDAVRPRASDIPFYSSVAGGVLEGERLDAAYWYQNLRQPVQFATALAAAGTDLVIEVSPHPVLLGAMRDILDAGAGGAAIGTLRRDDGSLARFRLALAEAYVAGSVIDLAPALGGARRIDLPTYPFQRQRHWFETGETGDTGEPLAAMESPHSEPRPAAPLSDLDRRLDEVVRSHVAAVLAHGRAEDVTMTRTFRDLGVDSGMSVQICDRLARVTGVRLANTALFDHPTPAALVQHLRAERALARTPSAHSVSPATTSKMRADEPIAIVGMACRLPGEIDKPEKLWQLLMTRGDAIATWPTDRGWDLERLETTSATRRGGFITQACEFDAEFFGISPREALGIWCFLIATIDRV
jgi:acyl transferase domain-containing protein